MKRSLAVCAAVVALLVTACGADDGSEAAASLSESLYEQATEVGEDISAEEADCAAEFLLAVFGDEDAQAVVDSGFEDLDGQVEERMVQALTDPELSERITGMSQDCRDVLQITDEDLATFAEMSEAGEVDSGEEPEDG